MLTREGALLLLSISGWTLFIAALLYQPFLFLTSFFLQTFYSTYILLTHIRLHKTDLTGVKVERHVEPYGVDERTILRVKLVVRLDGNRWLHLLVSDTMPLGTERVEGDLEVFGLLGPERILETSYVLRVNPSFALVRFNQVRIRIHDPLKLCYVERELNIKTEVIVPVGAKLVGTAYTRLSAAWIRPPMGIGVRGLVGYDDEFSGIKSYELGDRVRDIHWLRYARQVDEEDVVAKKYVKRGDVNLHIVVDCSASINAGEEGALIKDMSSLLRRLCQTAEEEGNSIQFWLINSALSIDEKISPRRVFSRASLEQYIARIIPSEERDSDGISKMFSEAIKPSSVAVFITNPPSQNGATVKEMIDDCRRVGARFIVCVPDMSSYVSGLDEGLRNMLELDELYKEKWLLSVAEGGVVVRLRRGQIADVAREAVKRGGEWV